MKAGAAWLAASLLFAALVGAGLHGFSIPAWHRFIDGSPEAEVLLGSARALRWDDNAVHIPMALSQRVQDPPFPVTNLDIGVGQNMLVPTGASLASPVAHPLTVFRPTLWGWFIGDDAGVAWMWWARVALGILPLAWAAALLGAPPALAAAVAILFAVGPGLQTYSWNGAAYVGFAALAFGACVRLSSARRTGALVGWALLLGWAGGCFALALYPPFQVTVGWTFALLLAAWAMERRRGGQLHIGRAQWAAVAAGCAIALGAGVFLLLSAGEAIEALRNTSYPGHRVSSGGNVRFWVPFSADLFALGHLQRHASIVSTMGSFAILFPISAYAALRGPAPRDRVALVLAGICAFLFVYQVIGIPEIFARASLLSFAPGERCFVALGAADALLLARVVSTRRASADSLRPYAVIGWVGVLTTAAIALRLALPDASPPLLVGAVAAQAVFAWLILSGRHAMAAVTGLTVLTALSTLWFNPLVRGGTEFIRGNELAQRIRTIDAENGGNTMWGSYGSLAIGNLFRIVGVRSLTGVHGIPQLGLWARVDPGERYLKTYNRFAHVLLGLPESGKPPFRSPGYDGLRVGFPPDGDELPRLGVTHLLVDLGEKRQAKAFARWKPMDRVGRHAMFALPLRERTQP